MEIPRFVKSSILGSVALWSGYSAYQNFERAQDIREGEELTTKIDVVYGELFPGEKLPPERREEFIEVIVSGSYNKETGLSESFEPAFVDALLRSELQKAGLAAKYESAIEENSVQAQWQEMHSDERNAGLFSLLAVLGLVSGVSFSGLLRPAGSFLNNLGDEIRASISRQEEGKKMYRQFERINQERATARLAQKAREEAGVALKNAGHWGNWIRSLFSKSAH